MYESLVKHCPAFHLYIFAFDKVTYATLSKLQLKNVTPISLSEFESEELLRVKPDRSAAEYCWTCTPSTILYSITRFNLDNCTYIDADLLFYSNPALLLEELNGKSVLITLHRYTEKFKYFEKLSGKYCVQFVYFNNTQASLEVLNWWANACLEWCYARFEDGKFGDQKYLDDWTDRFNCVKVLEHEGGGIAPWNHQNYLLETNRVINKLTNKKYELIFFHFHGVKFFSTNFIELSSTYSINSEFYKNIYIPYLETLLLSAQKYCKEGVFDPHGTVFYNSKLKFFLKRLKGIALNMNNIVALKSLQKQI